MKPKKVLLSKFRFDDFVNAVLSFIKLHNSGERPDFLKDLKIPEEPAVHPSYSVVWLEEDDDLANFGPEEGRDGFLDELRDGKKLFFPFTTGCVDNEVHLADRSGISYDDDSDDDDEPLLGDIDCAGFLLSLKGDFLTIETAVHCGGYCMHAPTVELHDCAEFENPMQKYIEQFINS